MIQSRIGKLFVVYFQPGLLLVVVPVVFVFRLLSQGTLPPPPAFLLWGMGLAVNWYILTHATSPKRFIEQKLDDIAVLLSTPQSRYTAPLGHTSPLSSIDRIEELVRRLSRLYHHGYRTQNPFVRDRMFKEMRSDLASAAFYAELLRINSGLTIWPGHPDQSADLDLQLVHDAWKYRFLAGMVGEGWRMRNDFRPDAATSSIS